MKRFIKAQQVGDRRTENPRPGEPLIARGPGKYDYLCTQVIDETQAKAAIVVVFDGKLGSGFSVQAPANIDLPALLRELADLIDGDRYDA